MSEIDVEPVAADNYSAAATAASGSANAAGMTSAINDLVDQLINASEAEMKEDLYDMMQQAQSGALDELSIKADEAGESEKSNNQAKQGEGEENLNQVSQASAETGVSTEQGTVAAQTQATVNSPEFVAATANIIATPEESSDDAVAPTASV